MSTYRIFFNTGASASVEVEADSFDEAVDLAYDRVPSGICAQCGGWGQDYDMDLGDDWEVDDSYEVDGKWIEAKP